MLFRAQLIAKTHSPLEAKAVYEALEVEAESQPTSLVSVEVTLSGDEVCIRLSSSKRAAFRAALNSFFRLLAALEGINATCTPAPIARGSGSLRETEQG